MGVFNKKDSDNQVEPETQFGIKNRSEYAEIFGTTGIQSDGSLDQEELENDLFFYVLDYSTDISRNYLANIQRGTMSKDEFFKVIETELQKKTDDAIVIDNVINKLETYIWGYYILDKYLNDESISDIRVIDENHIRIKRNGKREGVPEHFKDIADYKRFVDIICSRNKITLSDINAVQSFMDVKNNEHARLRFDIVSGLINSSGKPSIQIRKIPKQKKTLEDLLKPTNEHDITGMIPTELLSYLKDKAKTASGIIFTGKGASGKTTLMNAMLDEIPEDKAALVVQENDELFSSHPDMMFQHIIENKGEGKIKYTLKDLTINGLRQDLDYYVIGEIKGGEAAYFMNAAYTGHQCWASVHGVNSQEAMNKLVDYVKYETDYSKADVLRMLRFMNVIIFMKDFKISEISEIVGFDEEKRDLIYKYIYKDGKVVGL